MKISSDKKSVILNKKSLEFQNETIYKVYDFNDLHIVILNASRPLKKINYNNVIAFNANGILIWEVESDEKYDLENPYEGALFNGFYLILFKAKGQRVAVNYTNGKIIKNIDLNIGNRPW
ncbi:hypothetical protein [Changchengzhania lutea]|uniref:hypothetical protein n=1 Tax=Changchengzhania lutea TaxID=2049305 RepID=UPI00115F3EE2|nr:hypothetical protein [Changchengzhania lutea]